MRLVRVPPHSPTRFEQSRFRIDKTRQLVDGPSVHDRYHSNRDGGGLCRKRQPFGNQRRPQCDIRLSSLMNTLQLEWILRRDRYAGRVFRKVCALDQVQVPSIFPSAYVINSEPSSESGEHWVAVYFPLPGKAIYFDSYGLHPSVLGLESYLDACVGDNWIYNKKLLQALLSDVCGAYCVYFILFSARGYSLSRIQSHFSRNLYSNDRRIARFIRTLH